MKAPGLNGRSSRNASTAISSSRSESRSKAAVDLRAFRSIARSSSLFSCFGKEASVASASSAAVSAARASSATSTSSDAFACASTVGSAGSAVIAEPITSSMSMRSTPASIKEERRRPPSVKLRGTWNDLNDLCNEDIADALDDNECMLIFESRRGRAAPMTLCRSPTPPCVGPSGADGAGTTSRLTARTEPNLDGDGESRPRACFRPNSICEILLMFARRLSGLELVVVVVSTLHVRTSGIQGPPLTRPCGPNKRCGRQSAVRAPSLAPPTAHRPNASERAVPPYLLWDFPNGAGTLDCPKSETTSDTTQTSVSWLPGPEMGQS